MSDDVILAELRRLADAVERVRCERLGNLQLAAETAGNHTRPLVNTNHARATTDHSAEAIPFSKVVSRRAGLRHSSFPVRPCPRGMDTARQAGSNAGERASARWRRWCVMVSARLLRDLERPGSHSGRPFSCTGTRIAHWASGSTASDVGPARTACAAGSDARGPRSVARPVRRRRFRQAASDGRRAIPCARAAGLAARRGATRRSPTRQRSPRLASHSKRYMAFTLSSR